MPPFYWIIGFVAVAVLLWTAHRSNQKQTQRKSRHRSTAEAEAIELERENLRLRHVLAELSMDNHALRYTPPDYW